MRPPDQGARERLLGERFANMAITDMANTIPAFPKFKHLDLGDREEFDQFTRQYPPYSEFNFVNLFCYDTTGDCQVSILNGNLVVQFRDYITREPFCSFLGCTRLADTVERLMALSREQSVSPSLQLIPECCIHGALGDLERGFIISEDPDNADYIIDAPSLIALASSRWRNKREAASKFKRRHPQLLLQQINIDDAHTQEQVRRLFQTWAKKRHKTTHETQNELNAIERVMRHAQHFRLLSLGAFLNGRLEGFTINEVIHDGYAKATNVVVIDPALTKAFPNNEAVNDALRSLLAVATTATGMTGRARRTPSKRVAA